MKRTKREINSFSKILLIYLVKFREYLNIHIIHPTTASLITAKIQQQQQQTLYSLN